jgi:Uma2 family endonuclease
MNVLLTPAFLARPGEIVYPESDGEPMADNSIQFGWIVVLYDNLAALFRERQDVFVSGNQNWFPRQGETDYFKAPDVYVVFGRPKGHRRSWKQWEEDGVPMTVVFEILSPRNTPFEMARKLQFYDENGVEEYYVYDPESNDLIVYGRGQAALRLLSFKGSYVSPRLGIRFDLSGPAMTVFYPDGRRFLSFEELEEARLQAQRQADQARQEVDQANQRVARLAELSRKARRGQASAEELQELERLEEQAASP